MSNTTTTTVKIPNEILAKAYLLADELKSNKSQVIIKGTEWVTGLDKETIRSITIAGKELQMSESEIIEMSFTKWTARYDAHFEIYKRPLVDWIKADAKTQYIHYKNEAVIEYEKEVLQSIVDDQKNGIPLGDLNDVERRVVIKYRIEPFWSQSEEFKQEQEMKAAVERYRKENGIALGCKAWKMASLE